MAAAYSRYSKNQTLNSMADLGAASEMIVIADLLLRGFSVFRSMSPACKCDLLAMDSRNHFKIEVKTATRNSRGFLRFGTPSKNRFDFLALVLLDSKTVVYRPDFPSPTQD